MVTVNHIDRRLPVSMGQVNPRRVGYELVENEITLHFFLTLFQP